MHGFKYRKTKMGQIIYEVLHTHPKTVAEVTYTVATQQ